MKFTSTVSVTTIFVGQVIQDGQVVKSSQTKTKKVILATACEPALQCSQASGCSTTDLLLCVCIWVLSCVPGFSHNNRYDPVLKDSPHLPLPVALFRPLANPSVAASTVYVPSVPAAASSQDLSYHNTDSARVGAPSAHCPLSDFPSAEDGEALMLESNYLFSIHIFTMCCKEATNISSFFSLLLQGLLLPLEPAWLVIFFIDKLKQRNRKITAS